MSDTQGSSQTKNLTEQAVAKGGAYEIIRERLSKQAKQLGSKSSELNQQRIEEFGSTDMTLLKRLRLRTENNCEARDLVLVGDLVIFGYNAHIGLRKETKIDDVFAAYKLSGEEQELEAVPLKTIFLSDQSFLGDFRELYSYYKNTFLTQLVVKGDKLLASFQIGDRITDIRVFRWTISIDGKQVEYIDNRGERDIELPPSHDFEWTECQREDVEEGRHPHINILNTLFVDTLKNNLTIKIENNTNTGEGVYSDPVEDSSQSLDDAEFLYAEVGQLILLKIKPYREENWRYLIFNSISQGIVRVDAIGDSCVQLPDDHGIMFPGGYYLTTGELKMFDHEYDQLQFKKRLRSPNGEDVAYIFYQPQANLIGIYAYNLINKSLQNPIFGHGYGFYPDGRLVIFYAQEESTRVHPVQIWQTPYFSDDFASAQPQSQSFFGRIGNADIVRGISEFLSIAKLAQNEDVSVAHFHDISKRCEKSFDNFYWLSSDELSTIGQLIKDIAKTSELVIDEYEKVTDIQQQSKKALDDSIETQNKIITKIETENYQSIDQFVDTIGEIRRFKGHLLTIRELRYIDLDNITRLESDLIQHEENINDRTVEFLVSDSAFSNYESQVKEINKKSEHCLKATEFDELLAQLEQIAAGLDTLSELMNNLQIDDATLQTKIIDSISEVYSQINQNKAQLVNQRKNLGSKESEAQFAAQFKLLGQSVNNALSIAMTPDKCDEQLSRLLVQLDELEGRFSDNDQFLSDILSKREDIFETFESHKQTLLEAQQRRSQSIYDAASRILSSIERRVKRFSDQDELNSFFATDGLILKIHQLVTQLDELGDSVKSDDIDAKLKAAKDSALRSLRDKLDIYEDGGNLIKLGPRHKFSVNTIDLDLSLVPKSDSLFLHLTGTEYYESITDTALIQYSDYWQMSLPSETKSVYRGEYLAYSILQNALNNTNELSWSLLISAVQDEKKINDLMRQFLSTRYKEGYEKGIHDHDAIKILNVLIPNYDSAGKLKYSSRSRALAALFWDQAEGSSLSKSEFVSWPTRAANALNMQRMFASNEAITLLADEISTQLSSYASEKSLSFSPVAIAKASEYLIQELAHSPIKFVVSKEAQKLYKEFCAYLETQKVWQQYHQVLTTLADAQARKWSLTESWLQAYIEQQGLNALHNFVPEVISLLICDNLKGREPQNAEINYTIEKLLGQHPRIQKQSMQLVLDEFLERMHFHTSVIEQSYHEYHITRQDYIEQKKKQLRLDDFVAKPLTSFVRNKLINDVYLPFIGDNLAKQMGTVGDTKRTDLMGLLLMISPPGYGKTTLMEYVASRLGLVFMKINCPTIGHDVTSIDPEQAENSAAKQELMKINLAFEMGSNVMLYLDDIQHTNPEFLQKYISLCDGSRRIEGVWQNQPKTYDMRGKKFCVVMAGNPYTESGEAFRIPDMLANRADVYNLGDVLGGKEDVFDLSFLENSLTSNRVLAPLATRDMKDVYQLVEMARNNKIVTTGLTHQYSAAEVGEMTEVIRKLTKIQQVITKVNQEYVDSSAQDDKYRVEPPFKLQGSYRNMNKMAEKVSSVMTDEELNQLISDHYQGEAQLLTKGAEENLLKLSEIRQVMTVEQQARWAEIKQGFARNQSMGGDDADGVTKVVGQLNDLVRTIQEFGTQYANTKRSSQENKPTESLEAQIQPLIDSIAKIRPNVEVVNQPVPGIDKLLKTLSDTMKNSIFPLIKIMDGKLSIDLKTHDKMNEIENNLKKLGDIMGKG